MKFKSNYDNWLLKNENGRLNTESMSFDVVNCCTVRAKASSENAIHSFYIHLIFIRSFWSSGIDAYSATITHFRSESLNKIHDLFFHRYMYQLLLSTLSFSQCSLATTILRCSQNTFHFSECTHDNIDLYLHSASIDQ